MKILGVDPGLKATGYGVIEIDAEGRIKPLEVGSIEPKSRDTLPRKLFKIRQNLDDIVVRHAPQVMVLEKLYAHDKFPLTASILGHARGVICLVCAERGIELVEESPKRVRKSVVGNGNASKQQTLRVVANYLKIDPARLTLDASDALALALGYAHMSRFSR
jgi:crossover junction endodeoxyribonuclease RuvC